MYQHDFAKNVDNFYDYIDFGLQQKSASSIIWNTVGLIGDLCINKCSDPVI